jgi:hypothetical protein
MAIDDKITAIAREAADARMLRPYGAVNGLWVCVVKLANLMPRIAEEHEQIASLLRGFSREEALMIVSDRGVDDLLNLQPPLETVLAENSEKLYPLPAARQLERIRNRRTSDPRAALMALFEILQRIRNKREHGFKTPEGPRDDQILGAAALVLNRLVTMALARVRPAGSGEQRARGSG